MTLINKLSRRRFVTGSASVAATTMLAAPAFAQSARQRRREEAEAYQKMYGPMLDERFPLPAVDLSQIDPVYLRRFGDYQTNERPGTVIVDTANRVLFWTMPGGKAIRYGIGIGRAGFSWSGRAMINHKKQWPVWTPPTEMIDRQPELQEWRQGMPPGLGNPLGARALYIFDNGADTLYRLHGTSETNSIGTAVSSGCVRLLQHDVIDLYNRVPDKTQIIVL